jgi:hypothetical protein
VDKKEQLKAMIDGIIKGDDAAAKNAFAPYVQAKTRDILGYSEPAAPTPEVTNEAFLMKLKEFNDIQAGSPVQFRGDKVMVDGKQVGVIQNDPTDWESGINFIEEGGRFSKEFDTLEAVYDFLIQRYTKGGAIA